MSALVERTADARPAGTQCTAGEQQLRATASKPVTTSKEAGIAPSLPSADSPSTRPVAADLHSALAQAAPQEASQQPILRLAPAGDGSDLVYAPSCAARTHGDVQDNVALQATWHAEAGTASALAHHLGRLAVAALHAELRCAPKPGLVTPFDNGSHADMDATTFLRSLFALRGYFVAIAQAGIDNAPFEQLRQLGIAAEVAMLRATGGINTHRGAIFSLGVLTAQAARLRAVHGHAPTGEAVCNAVQVWRDALCAAPLDPRSNGQRARARFQIGGVREQAADGYPLLREIALPSLRSAMQNGATREAALAQTLMQLVAEVDDLNLLHRGAQEGLAYAKTQARGFLAEGGIAQPQWRARLHAIGRQFVARHLSPGGSADLLACAWFLQCQETA
ncbi:triphosphoribosyl-dephospho-CoA synthase MdcB [Xanthomonas arboricola pv. juglandis]|nr:triphosphoribosyl-dephospho-CoA synthase MdcB [Xanthomonas arboricola pv. juglandis]